MLGMLFAPKLKRMFNAKQLFIIATIWHSVCLAIVFAMGMNTPWYIVAGVMFVTMLPVGVLNVVPHLMAADTIDYWEHKTGQRQEGITYALMGLRSNISSGLKDYFLTFLLSYFLFSQPLGFIDGHEPVQSEYTKQGLFAIYTIIPAVLNLVSILPMIFYNLTGERIHKIQAELAGRHEAEREADARVESGEPLMPVAAVGAGYGADVLIDEIAVEGRVPEGVSEETEAIAKAAGTVAGGGDDE